MFLLVLHVGKGVRVGKRESRTEETGKVTTASEAGCVPPITTPVSCSRCHYRMVEAGRQLWRSSLLLWRQQGAGHFEAFWSLILQAAAYFFCFQSQSCKIFYLLLKRSVCNLLQIYFNTSKTIHTKRLQHKIHKLLLHLFYIYYH